METADRLTGRIMEIFSIQFSIAECRPSDIPQHKEFFVASYVAGFCDVMAQGAGAKAGGNLSMTLAGRIMQKIFGNTHGDYMFKKVDEAMHTRDPICFKVLLIGAKDANCVFGQTLSFKLAEYLSQK